MKGGKFKTSHSYSFTNYDNTKHKYGSMEEWNMEVPDH